MPTVLGGFLDLVARGLGTGLEPGTFLELVRGIAQLAALAIAVRVALTWPTGDRVHAVRAVAAVMGAVILLSPVVHLWYFLWALPFLAAIRLPRLGTVGLLAAVVISGLVAPLDSSLHGAYVAIVVGSLLVTALVLALLATRTARERLEKIATAPWLPVGSEPVFAQVAGRIRPVTSPSAIRPPDVPRAV